jgi:dihydroorotase-like cyclic amidohydrolase
MEMPNCNPQTISEAALRDKHARAARVSLANWAFYLGATNDNPKRSSLSTNASRARQSVHGRIHGKHVGRQSVTPTEFFEYTAADCDAL